MEYLPHQIVTLAALCFAYWSKARHPLKSNGLFFFVLAQAIVYLFVAPTGFLMIADGHEHGLAGDYLWVQSVALVGFLPVFYYAYLIAVRGRRTIPPATVLDVDRSRLPAFVMFACIGSLFYLLVLYRYGLMFRSLGHVQLANEYASLPRLIYLFMRVFDRLLLPLAIVSTIACLRARTPRDQVWSRIGLVVVAGIQLLLASLNSRLTLVTSFAMLGLVGCLTQRGGGSIRLGEYAKSAVILALCFAGLTFTVSLRSNWEGDLASSVSSTFSNTRSESASSHLPEDTALRLNGIDLAARMTPDLYRLGHSYGSSWVPGVIAAIGGPLGVEAAKDLKADLATSPKYYLMYTYAAISLPDYPSCCLTDAYGNFGVLGVIACGLWLGALCGSATRWLRQQSSVLTLAVGVVVMQVACRFEASFLSHLLTEWITQLPILLTLLLFTPFKKNAKAHPPTSPALSTSAGGLGSVANHAPVAF